jgi:hypothetical protein
MYSALLGIVEPVDILKARDKDGKWFRRPIGYKECYSNNESKSTISRDMMIGLLYWLYYNNKGQEAEELLKYGRDHNWVMGEGDLTATFFTPALQATLALVIEKLTGNKYLEVNYPQSFSKNESYQAQLTVLHILLRAKILGKVTDKEFEILKYQHDRVPSNALFSYGYHKYSDGNQEETLAILLNTQLFPNNAIPNTNNYCTDWLWSRDPGADWQPCPEENETWTGGEFLFVAKLLLDDLK